MRNTRCPTAYTPRLHQLRTCGDAMLTTGQRGNLEVSGALFAPTLVHKAPAIEIRPLYPQMNGGYCLVVK